MADAARTKPTDIIAQAWCAIVGRRTRSTLTAAGISLGIAAVVATLALTSSAAGAISDKFDALRATQITLRWPESAPQPGVNTTDGVSRLHGVAQAGLMCSALNDDHTTTLVAPGVASVGVVRVALIAAQPSALAALNVTAQQGRMFDEGHGRRHEPVALIDSVTARDLRITGPVGRQLIYLDGRPVSVLGVYDAPPGEARLTGAVVVPYQWCQDNTPTASQFGPADLVIRTAIGAAAQVATEAKLAASPTQPDLLVAMVPPDLSTFRKGVENDTRSLYLGLGLVSLVIGALGISNTTLVSVLERRAEIGLRRAVGASQRAVAAQFLVESGLLGLAGGIAGTIIAMDVTAGVALAQNWVIVGLIAAGPLAGLIVGMLAGIYPAWTASRVSPALSLRT